MLDRRDGEVLIKFVRSVIKSRLDNIPFSTPEDIKSKYSQKKGAFVTLYTYPSKMLRGCIGIPRAIYPLYKTLEIAAIGAAFEDPRFLPLRKEEFDKIIVEISLLSEPEEIVVDKREDLPKHIKIGRDGLIIKKGLNSGLLLPQVPVEYGWDVVEFLNHTCIKAGLPPFCWLDPSCKVYKFTAQIFEELRPFGNVVEIKLRK